MKRKQISLLENLIILNTPSADYRRFFFKFYIFILLYTKYLFWLILIYSYYKYNKQLYRKQFLMTLYLTRWYSLPRARVPTLKICTVNYHKIICKLKINF
jgi:hypothetical protein